MNPTERNRVRGAEGATVVAPALSSDDPRLTQAVEEYLVLLRAGKKPDRQAFLDRDPAIAGPLADCLDALEFIQSAAGGLQQLDPMGGPTLLTEETKPSVPLGDYQIVREIGKGGMGVVYEAVQLSLGRRVALKILPFASALDTRQLQRFKHEAQTAAQLHHPNIVPIYHVGYERGVHYYAMQFIEGKTLAAFIDVLRDSAGLEVKPLPSTVLRADKQPSQVGDPDLSSTRPDPPIPIFIATPETAKLAGLATERSIKHKSFVRSVAELGIQAAEALEHAHQVGVVHRDIKPANLLVDMQGKLWITDFGLARFQHNPQLTVTGDVVGTWRYMSPEQALGQRMLVDHRTDIYSLGVTLYELLTLSPACDGQDRQELLRQIAHEEPRALRQINESLPVELETIVLKAIAKRPEERYTTAQDFADDLRRFLEDKPVLAQRPSLRERMIKWSRRHRPLVAAAAGMLVLAVVFLGVTTALFYERNQELRKADQKLMAERQKLEENQQRLLNEQESLNQNLHEAFKFLQDFTYKVYLDQSKVGRDPETRREVQARLSDIWDFYKKAQRVSSAKPGVRRERANGLMSLGKVQYVLGELSQAESAYSESLTGLKEVLAEQPRDRETRTLLAQCYAAQAELLLVCNRFPEAENAFRDTMAVYQAMIEEFPTDGNKPWWILYAARARHQLSNLYLSTGRAKEAEISLREALPMLQDVYDKYHCPPSQSALAECNIFLGSVLKETGRITEAEKDYRQALAFAEPLVKLIPQEREYKMHMALALFNIASIQRVKGKLEEARKGHTRALTLLKPLVQACPGEPNLQQVFGLVQHELGLVLVAMGRTKEAEEAYTQAVEVLRSLVRDYPANQSYQASLGLCLGEFGLLRERMGNGNDAEKHFREAAEIYSKLTAGVPGMHEYQSNLGNVLGNLARALHRDHKDEEAGRCLERAILALETALRGNPLQLFYRGILGQQYLNFTTLLLSRGDYSRVPSIAEKMAALYPKSPNDAWRAAGLLAQCAQLTHADAKLENDERDALEQTYHEAMVRFLHQAEDRCANDPELLNNLAWQLAHYAQAPLQDLGLALRLAERAVKVTPQKWEHLNTLGTIYYRTGDWQAAIDTLMKGLSLHAGGESIDFFFLAMAHWQLGQKSEARQWYDKGVTWMQQKNKQKDAELRRFQGEAAALLGISVQTAKNQTVAA